MTLFLRERILVPIDFSEEAFIALDNTLEFIGDPAKIHVLHVLPPLEATEPGVVWETIDDDRRAENVTKAFYQKRSTEVDKSLHFKVATGNASSEIIDYAAQNDINLIVIPSHGRTGIARFFLGSVAERVVRFSPCPVLVLRREPA
ncbi:MAG: universal stress protein [Leptolyngbyaceae cyanobacterium SM1_1_3]|nr:universal stress protein [Leptolyngbyaceae cyanobacterium SM1_1_3]NJN03736.1 universal stress protein [Leptolyngbyaceae cyanobacterium RM1_1_2]NJO09361.1 universal stress protein [Leptolyngbyaceae cyanobacterium SL_1_1]